MEEKDEQDCNDETDLSKRKTQQQQPPTPATTKITATSPVKIKDEKKLILLSTKIGLEQSKIQNNNNDDDDKTKQLILSTTTRTTETSVSDSSADTISANAPPTNTNTTEEQQQLPRKKKVRKCDVHIEQEMDVVAVEETRSYRAWKELSNGQEFIVCILPVVLIFSFLSHFMLSSGLIFLDFLFFCLFFYL